MIGASLLLLALALDGRLGLIDSALLFGLLLAYTVFLVRQSRAETQAARDEYAAESKPQRARRLGRAAAGATGADRRRPGPAGARLRLAGVLGHRLCQGAGRQRPGHRPDHRRRRHVDARGGHIDHGRDQGRARHRRRQRGRQQHLQHPWLPGHLGSGGWPDGAGDTAVGAELRPLGDDRRGAGLPAGVPDRARDRALGRRRVPAVLRGLRRLPDPGGATARRTGQLLQRDAQLRDPDHRGHAGGDVAASGARRRPSR